MNPKKLSRPKLLKEIIRIANSKRSINDRLFIIHSLINVNFEYTEKDINGLLPPEIDEEIIKPIFASFQSS